MSMDGWNGTVRTLEYVHVETAKWMKIGMDTENGERNVHKFLNLN